MRNAICHFLDDFPFGVFDDVSEAGINARGDPRSPKCFDLFAIAVKQPWDDLAGRSLQRFRFAN